MGGKYCEDCAYKIINEKSYYIKGIGNKQSNKIIVFPHLGFNDRTIINSEAFKQISGLYNTLFDRNILDDYYITCFVKCPISIKHPIDVMTKARCYNYLREEVTNNKYNILILLGNACSLINVRSHSTNNVYRNCTGHYVFVNYSPFVIRYDLLKDSYISKFTSIFKAIAYNNLKEFIIKDL